MPQYKIYQLRYRFAFVVPVPGLKKTYLYINDPTDLEIKLNIIFDCPDTLTKPSLVVFLNDNPNKSTLLKIGHKLHAAINETIAIADII